MAITASTLKALANAPPRENTLLWDESVVGFLARISPKGRVTFAIDTRAPDGTQLRHSFGRLRDTPGSKPAFTVQEARARAKKILRNIRLGLTPEGNERKRPSPSEELTFGNFYTGEFLPQHGKYLSPAYYRELRKFGEQYFKPWEFWSKPLSAVTRLDVEKVRNAAWERGRYTLGNRLVAVLKSALNKAKAWDLLQGENPAAGVELKPEQQREKYLTKEQRKAFLDYLDAHTNRKMANLLWVTAMTGSRPSEVMRMRWEDIDFAEGTWTKQRTKHGYDVKVPLLPAVVERLIAIRSDAGRSQWVFPGRSGDQPVKSYKKFWEECRRALGLQMRCYDATRHTFASVGAEAGLSLEQLAPLMGHRSFSTTRRYAHLDMRAQQQTLDKIGSAF